MSKTEQWQLLKGKVGAAFEALRKNGIHARGPIGFDKGEAIEKVDNAGARGFAYYHSQDAQGARGGGNLWIGFGSAASGKAAAIGREVAGALEGQGLHVDWNGSAKTRLAVHLSADAARQAALEEKHAAERHAAGLRKLEADRLEPTTFFGKLRATLEDIGTRGPFHVVFGDRVAYPQRRALVAQHRKTVVVCPLKFLPTWDKLNIDVTTYPEEHDKTVVKQVAEHLRKAGFKVAYIHGSYLHVRTTTATT
jgi:hypothetical protein